MTQIIPYYYYTRPRDVIYADYIPITTSDREVLTLTEVKQHLAIDECDHTNDIQLQTMIEAVRIQAETITGKTLITTTFVTYRNYFPINFMLKKSPIQSLISIQFLLNAVPQTVSSSIYELTQSRLYPMISLLPFQVWPTDYDRQEQTIKITFIAGFGDTESSIPKDLKIAMLNHVATWWANRGDCSCDCSNTLPAASKAIYGQYTVKSLTGLPPLGTNNWYGGGYW